MTKTVNIGGVIIGGGNPIAIQSMTNTDTKNTDATVEQILRLESAGCEIIRVAAPDIESAKNIKNIKDRIHIPIVADVHFDYRIAIAAIESGADKVRINPGNIGSKENIKRVADAAKCAAIPIRVGANSGSLRKDLKGEDKPVALVESTLDNIRALNEFGFYNIVAAVKASDVKACVKATRLLSESTDVPLHIGVTEAGSYSSSIIKSSIGIGALLLDDIGDTIRVSITGDPIKEIEAAKNILQYTGLRRFASEIISCPTCARTHTGDLEAICDTVKSIADEMGAVCRIAVMGCEVNGPGEAADADIGIALGKDCALIFKHGQIIKKVSIESITEAFRKELANV